MSEPLFYIFGVPNGFDMLDGDLKAQNYFQSFYNPSRENTKFSIYRDPGDGTITYAYLKYNLSSGGGREGSFFGMALAFTENACCTDIMKLYRLFDTVYEKVILPDGEILVPTNGTSYIQAKYTITRFHEKQAYIEGKIRSILLSNIQKFETDFIAVDDSFSSDEPDLGVRIPLSEADNRKLLNILQRYNRLSVSPNWKSVGGTSDHRQQKPELSIERLWQWYAEIKEYSLFLNECYRDLSRASINRAKEKARAVNNICKILKEYKCPDSDNSEILRRYNETKEQYATFGIDYAVLIEKLENVTPPPPPPPPLPPSLWERFKEWLEWHKTEFYGSVAAIFILVAGVGCYFVLRPDHSGKGTVKIGGYEKGGRRPDNDTTATQPDSTVNYLDTVRVYLSSNDGERFRHSIDCIDEHKDEISNADALRDSIYDVWANELTKAREYSSAFDYAHGLGEQYRPLETRIQTNADAYFKTCIPSKCTSINQCKEWEKLVNGCTALPESKKREYLDIIQKKKSSLDTQPPSSEDKSKNKVKLNTFQLTKCNTSWGSEGTPVNIQEGSTIPYNVQKSTKYIMYLYPKRKFDQVPIITNADELKKKGYNVKVKPDEATIRILTSNQSQNATMKIKTGDKTTTINFKVKE